MLGVEAMVFERCVKSQYKILLPSPDKIISVQGLCCSAARSFLCRLVSEACNVWNRADPIFDAWYLVLTNHHKRSGEILRPDRNIKKMADSWYSKANSTQNHSFSFVGLFFALFNINSSSKTTPNYCLHQMNLLDEATLMTCPLVSRLCHIYIWNDACWTALCVLLVCKCRHW